MNPHCLNKLLSVWPRAGAESAVEATQLSRLASTAGIRIDPRVSRDQLRRSVCNVHHRTAAHRTAGSVPWKYQRYLKPNQNLRQQAIKLQPGATVPVSFNGMETTMYVDTARRLQFRGKPWFIELKVKLSTEHIPIILTRESKCECLYCGRQPHGDEDSCKGCGAPLPSC